MTIPVTTEELTLHPDMAGALMTPEEFDLSDALARLLQAADALK